MVYKLTKMYINDIWYNMLNYTFLLYNKIQIYQLKHPNLLCQMS